MCLAARIQLTMQHVDAQTPGATPLAETGLNVSFESCRMTTNSCQSQTRKLETPTRTTDLIETPKCKCSDRESGALRHVSLTRNAQTLMCRCDTGQLIT